MADAEAALTFAEFERLPFSEQIQYIEALTQPYSWSCPFCLTIFWCCGKPPSQEMIEHVRTHPEAKGIYYD